MAEIYAQTVLIHLNQAHMTHEIDCDTAEQRQHVADLLITDGFDHQHAGHGRQHDIAVAPDRQAAAMGQSHVQDTQFSLLPEIQEHRIDGQHGK